MDIKGITAKKEHNAKPSCLPWGAHSITQLMLEMGTFLFFKNSQFLLRKICTLNIKEDDIYMIEEWFAAG